MVAMNPSADVEALVLRLLTDAIEKSNRAVTTIGDNDLAPAHLDTGICAVARAGARWK